MTDLRIWTVATLDLLMPFLADPRLPLAIGAFVAGVAICPCDNRPLWPIQIARGALLGASSFVLVLALQALAIGG